MRILPSDFRQKFSALCKSDSDAEYLLDIVTTNVVAKGDQLIVQDQFNDSLYFLWEGRLSMFLQAGEVRIAVGEVVPGRWVGELGFIDPGPTSANVLVEEESTLLVISRDGFEKLLQQRPEILSTLLQALSLDLAERLRETENHVLKRAGNDEFSLSVNNEQNDSHESWFDHIAKKLHGARGA